MNQAYGVLHLAGCEFAVEATALQEVLNWPEQLTPHPDSPAFVLGLFSLRGQAVPLIELPGGRGIAGEGRKVAVLVLAEGLLAVAIDGVVDMLNLQAGQFGQLTGEVGQTGGPSLFSSVAVIGTRLIYRLDLARLSSLPGVLLTRIEGSARQLRERRANFDLQHFLIFACDGRDYAIDAAIVTELVDRPQLVPGTFRGDSSPGVAMIRGAQVPVLHLTRLLGLKSEPIADKPQLLVLATAEGARFGIAYDRLESLQRCTAEAIRPLPPYGLGEQSLLGGVLSFDDQRKALLLDHAALVSCKTISKLAQLYHRAEGSEEPQAVRRAARQPACLVFRAPHVFVAPLVQIQEILWLPPQIIGFAQPGSHLLGYFDVRGETLPLVCLSGLLDPTATVEHGDARVLVVRGDQGSFGLVVDGIDTIDSFSQFDPERLGDAWPVGSGGVSVQAHARSLVSIGGNSGRTRLATLVDLEAVVRGL